MVGMKRLTGIRRFYDTPLRLAQTIVATTSLLGALYFLTPLYAIGRTLHPTPLTAILTNPLWVLILGIVLAVGGLCVLIGLYLDTVRWRSTGFFIIFLVRLYQVFAILIVAGPFPLQWLSPLTLALICIVLRAAVNRGQSTWL